MTDAGANFADTAPFSSRLIATEPMAMPIEKIARNRLATFLLALNTFFTSGGNWMNITAPMPQKKLISRIARNTRRIFSVLAISVHDARKMFQSTRSGVPIGGAGGTWRAVKNPMSAIMITPNAASRAVRNPAVIVPSRIAT